jgi:hypothetical protein
LQQRENRDWECQFLAASHPRNVLASAAATKGARREKERRGVADDPVAQIRSLPFRSQPATSGINKIHAARAARAGTNLSAGEICREGRVRCYDRSTIARRSLDPGKRLLLFP